MGLTAIVGVTGLIVMLILFGEFRKRFEPVYEIKLSMPSTAGVGGPRPCFLMVSASVRSPASPSRTRRPRASSRQ